MAKQRKRQNKKTGYKGILKKPIIYDRWSSAEEQTDFIRAESRRKLDTLCDLFHIESGTGMYFHLALALARAHVPGFKIVPNTQRPAQRPDKITGTGIEGALLVAKITKQMKQRQCNLTTAIETVWEIETEFREYSTDDSLKTAYFKAIKPLPEGSFILNMLKDLAKQEGSTQEQFEEKLIACIPKLIDALKESKRMAALSPKQFDQSLIDKKAIEALKHF